MLAAVHSPITTTTTTTLASFIFTPMSHYFHHHYPSYVLSHLLSRPLLRCFLDYFFVRGTFVQYKYYIILFIAVLAPSEVATLFCVPALPFPSVAPIDSSCDLSPGHSMAYFHPWVGRMGQPLDSYWNDAPAATGCRLIVSS